MSKPSKNSLLVAVANLERAASDHSHHTIRSRQAANILLAWLERLPSQYHNSLPLGCSINEEGEFSWTVQLGPNFGGAVGKMTIVKGHEHSSEDLFFFCQLIDQGFITLLGKMIEQNAIRLAVTADLVTQFVETHPLP